MKQEKMHQLDIIMKLINAQYSKIGVFLSQIQFPWRYLLMATFFSTLTLGELLDNYANDKFKFEFSLQNICVEFVAVCVFIEALFWFCSYSSGAVNRLKLYNTNEVHLGYVPPNEYLRYDANTREFTNKITAKNTSVRIKSRRGVHFVLSCETDKNNGIITMPLLNYKGYQVFDENGTNYTIMDGPNKEVQFILPEGFQGEVTVEFQPFWYWKAAIIVSMLYFVFLICLIAKNFKNRYIQV